VLCGRRADTVRRLHEDRKQDMLMQICISPLGIIISEILRWFKTTTNRLSICDNGRSYLTEAWCLGPGPGHQPADRTLRTPTLLCGRCAVVQSVFIETGREFSLWRHLVSVDGDADAALETRIRIGWNKFRQLVPLLTNKDISLTVHACMCACMCICTPNVAIAVGNSR